jgi:multicomponent K+:H+ antiporter subunit E
MNRLVPFPRTSVALTVSWVALTGFSVASVLMALVIAVGIPLSAQPFLKGLPRARRPVRALRLLGIVLWDILVANVVVARLVLGSLPRLEPAFVKVPLAVTHPHTRSLLATIITMTPGTVSAAFAPDGRLLHVHALNVSDPARLVTGIKERYERPLLEIFEW